MAEGARLEIVCALIPHRGFDSHSLRHCFGLNTTFLPQNAWYKDKEDEMKKGALAPSYVPKLRTYIDRYYFPFFWDADVREVRSLRATR